jgi:hypothetical protein
VRIRRTASSSNSFVNRFCFKVRELLSQHQELSTFARQVQVVSCTAWRRIASEMLVISTHPLCCPIHKLPNSTSAAQHQAARSQIGADVELREPHDPGPCEGEGEQHVPLIGHDAAAGIPTAIRSAPCARPPVPFGRHREVQTRVLV